MAPKLEHLLPLASLILILCLPSQIQSHSHSHSPPSAAELHKSVCQKSNDYKGCMRTMKLDPRLASASDIDTLAKVAMLKAQKKSVSLSDRFAEMENDQPDPKVKEALKMCAFDFKDAKIFFNPRLLGDPTGSLDIHSALDNWQNCETLMAENPDLQKMAPALRRWKHLYAVANGAVVYAEDESDSGDGGDYP